MDFMSLLCSDYNDDWPPISEAEITYSTNHSFPFAPVTPDHAKQFEKPHRSEMRNFSGDESSSQEKDKQENLFTSILSDAAQNGCNQLLQDIVDSSSAAISPPLTEKNISELGDNQGIDLNKTPEQKTPKRRKHRPKVIVEGKPKRTPKTPTPSKTNSENPSGKRKYVRRNIGTTPTPQQKDATDAETIPIEESPAKSSRRKLDFDFDLLNVQNGEIQGNTINIQAENNQANGTGFYLNFDSQASRLGTGINSISTENSIQEKMQSGYSGENQQVQSMLNLTHSINQMLDENIQFPERRVPAARPTAIRNDAINVIARSVNSNTSFLQRTHSNIREHHQCLQGELNRRLIPVNSPTRNLETTTLPSMQHIGQSTSMQHMRKSTPQNPGRDVADYNGERGHRGLYLNATHQASPSFKDQADSSFPYPRIYKDHNGIDQISSSWCSETRDRKTFLNGFHSTIFRDDSRKVATGEPPSWLSTLQKIEGNNAAQKTSQSFKDQADSALLYQSMYRGHNRIAQSSSSRWSETHGRNMGELPSWQSTPQEMERNIAVCNENRGFKRPYLNATQQASSSYQDWADLYHGTYKDHSRIDQSSSLKCSETLDRNRVLNNFYPTGVKDDLRKVAMEGRSTVYQGTYQDHSRINQSSSFKCSENLDRNRVPDDFHPTGVKDDLRKVAMEGRSTVSQGTYKDHSRINQSSSFKCSENLDRNRVRDDFHPTGGKEDLRKVAVEGRTTVYPSTNVSLANDRTSNYHIKGDIPKKLKSGYSNSMPAMHFMQNQLIAFEQHSVANQRPNRSTQVQDISSTLIGKSNLLPAALPRVLSTSGYKQGSETCPSTTPLKLKNMASTSLNPSLPYTDKVLQQEHKGIAHGNQQIPKKPRGRPKKTQQTVVTIDDITSQLQVLCISSRSEKTHAEEQSSLVLYEGNGKLVPYEDPTKKRKPRPKVDLDPDTNRVWKLLMGKEGSEDGEAPDKDKEKWWENERNVFRGRADSFIARMHLVQGDRRFSRWKGSVVDSVIGVFLTQNVSDHLSSSAFMSLAARFPLQVTSTKECFQSEASILPKEQKNQIPDLNGTVQCFEETVTQQVYNFPYPSFHEPRTEDTNSTTGITDIATELVVTAERNASSSQNSSDSLILRQNGEFQYGVGSNSEAEDLTCRGRSHTVTSPPIRSHVQSSFQVFHNPRTDSLCFGDPSAQCHKHQEDILGSNNTFGVSNFSHIRGVSGDPSDFQLHMRPGLEAQGIDSLGLSRDESVYSLPSTIYGVPREKGTGFLNRSGYNARRMGETFRQENGVPVTQAPKAGPCYPTRDSTHLGSSLLSVSRTSKDQSPLGSHQPPTRPTETVFTGQTSSSHRVSCGTEYSVQAFGEKERAPLVEKLKPMHTKVVEVNAKEQVISSGETTGTSTNMPNARKGKAEDDKSKSFDWDILRKNVLADGRIKESSKDAMDSMDYETMRCVNVNEISNAIKERGMNNMLAERMKDFLNRLVKDHGSIDLEWLRDVPPDKAKDYLLSIRGLGLKSVECVRLLTLHHLAFPVDTNVGRIAVRLGWVPLQPLPESLQLHLLELYPMLETIQKYLWPRLCKLDQRTLYELHYQMITFGKVFCTKSKPNCNACPMRGECRHFASAFASARLALPGPEEKSIVSSNAPVTNQKTPVAAINPIPLLQASNKEHRETDSVRNYEPIVEEPATPEPETEELSLSDIEDAFYEDPDEIPTIKLNVEEFAMNLHNYMQENMELQEGDMSRALVALNPEAPSIPTQKLKNVSRLRTEHQVYELPDSHPLLEGMDKREPDDPSPYLLAIWTPGETPNSIQPPESGCEFQESGKLCDKSTCFSCNNVRESNSQTVRGTILVPCRTAMRGSFPLNGTYFQVNEVFADHESSLNPINVPRALIWNLPRRTVYFGTSVSTIFKGLSVEGIQFCFWKGFVCVRGFDQKSRAPRPLKARLHFPASKLQKRQ